MTVARCAARRIEFVWRARCCCDYNYPVATECEGGTGVKVSSCCSEGRGDNPGATINEVVGSPGDSCYSSTTLGTASGGGWRRAVEYHFHVELTDRLIRIYRSIPDEGVAPVLIFNYARPPSNKLDISGTFAYYTRSQPNVSLGPLEIAGEMGFGTEGCSTHVPT